MKKSAIIVLSLLVLVAAFVFAACNKQNNGSGKFVFVTDENGQTVLDKNGEPLTEEWITEVIYATDENGETYTNANGEKVTVKQTAPVLTSIQTFSRYVADENGVFITDKNGEKITELEHLDHSRFVTNENGNVVTVTVTDKNGETVTDKNKEPVTEAVTEKYTEIVTEIIKIDLNSTQVSYAPKPTPSKTTTKKYTEAKPTDTDSKFTLPAEGKITASRYWIAGLGGNGDDVNVKTIKVTSSSFAVLGVTNSTTGNFKEFSQKGYYSYLAKYNDEGKLLWLCPIGSSGTTKMRDVAMLKDGSFICVGESTASDLSFENPDKTSTDVIVKISADGKVVWYKTYGGARPDYFTNVAATSDGGFVAAGRFASTDGSFASYNLTSIDVIIAKFNSSGEIVWSDKFGGSKSDNIHSLAVDPSGNIYAAMSSKSADGDFAGSSSSTDIAIAKYTSNGNRAWVKIIKGSGTDTVNDIYAGSKGCIFVGNTTSYNGDFDTNKGKKDGYVAFLNASDGSIKWLRTYGGLDNDSFTGIVPTEFGYAVTGQTASSDMDFKSLNFKGGYDAFVMSIDYNGNIKHLRGIGGTGTDNATGICRLDSTFFIVCGSTTKSDGELESLKPATSSKNNAFVIKYKIW